MNQLCFVGPPSKEDADGIMRQATEDRGFVGPCVHAPVVVCAGALLDGLLCGIDERDGSGGLLSPAALVTHVGMHYA
eukprot:4076901-Pyramimonas_sp.AAC.2